MTKYTAPKGVFDILPSRYTPSTAPWLSSENWQFIENIIRKTAVDFCFHEIRTPIFESTELFTRTAGETSDVVSKEMYSFLDRKNRPISLRPEGTAPVIRSFLENHLDQKGGPVKLFYMGPMFRYERPQAGRFRQHHQFGAETIGISSPWHDAEMIAFLIEVYKRAGIQNLTVLINSVGDKKSRELYSQKLREYLEPQKENLSADSLRRLDKNVLRILDSKDPQDQKLLLKAPMLHDFLSEGSLGHLKTVQKALANLGISFEVHPKLVRGLDYYNETVFEVLSNSLGSQNTMGAGGRYDGLTAQLGGKELPSFGFATGLERVLETIGQQISAGGIAPFVTLIPLGEAALQTTFSLLQQLRTLFVPAEIDYRAKKVQQGIDLALTLNSTFSVVIGDDELALQACDIKNLQTRLSTRMPLDQLPLKMAELYRSTNL